MTSGDVSRGGLGPAWEALLPPILEITGEELEVAEVMRRVAPLVTEVTGADTCFVHLHDEARGRLVLAGATPPFDALVGTIELAVGEGVAGWVVKTGQPAVIDDKWRGGTVDDEGEGDGRETLGLRDASPASLRPPWDDPSPIRSYRGARRGAVGFCPERPARPSSRRCHDRADEDGGGDGRRRQGAPGAYAVTETLLREVFAELVLQRVELASMVLKPNMVVPGKACPRQASVDEVADATLRCLARTVPAAVPGSPSSPAARAPRWRPPTSTP